MDRFRAQWCTHLFSTPHPCTSSDTHRARQSHGRFSMSLDDFLGSVMLFASSTILSTRAVTWHGFAPAGLPVWDTPTFWTGYLIAGKLFISCIWNPLAFLPKWETFRIKRFHIAKWFQEEPWVETCVWEPIYKPNPCRKMQTVYPWQHISCASWALRVSQRLHVKKTHPSSCPLSKIWNMQLVCSLLSHTLTQCKTLSVALILLAWTHLRRCFN